MDLRDGGKLLIWTGLGMAAVGAALWVGARLLGGRRMPLDFVYESERVKVYVPIGTCLLVSAGFSALMWVINRFR